MSKADYVIYVRVETSFFSARIASCRPEQPIAGPSIKVTLYVYKGTETDTMMEIWTRSRKSTREQSFEDIAENLYKGNVNYDEVGFPSENHMEDEAPNPAIFALLKSPGVHFMFEHSNKKGLVDGFIKSFKGLKLPDGKILELEANG